MDTSLQDLTDCLNQLSEQFEELREGVRKAIDGAMVDPEMALIRSRKVLEYVIRDVFVRRVGEPPGTRPLEGLIQRLVKDGHFPPRLEAYTETIRKLGNVGAHHFGQRISAADVYQSLTQLMPILEWYFEVERPDAGVHLDLPHEPRPTRIEHESQDGGRTSQPHVAVVPKGLRSFDANDSDFFLQLLPGPRDRSGLPESIRFWKHRIESTDDPSFTVGIIYGPSGCGKSSLVKAGLLPRLSKNIIPIYIEATPDDTEVRLLKGLRKRLPDLPADLDLTQTITALCQRQGSNPERKVVIVLDQFEQWLHAHRTELDMDLARALRQCDGDHVQCVVMVRDDFWMALTRFMSDLHIELAQGRNIAPVDLFDQMHARKVLAEFGKAFGRLPDDLGKLSKEQDVFLSQTIEGLAQDGRVISIRLSLFAEMVKGKPWTPTTLKDVGGTAGVGVSFLEETFSSTSLRSHRRAAVAVLKALLPESGTGIKGHMRSHEELLEASGYAGRPREFTDLFKILDNELRLITPTDPEDSSDERTSGEAGGRYYQLTHDYLVPSLREWLTRKQRETRRGRAELRLVERSSLWNAKPENRHLPSVWEWANIRLLTKKKDWTEPQRMMMKRAGRVHGLRSFVTVALLGAGVVAGLNVRRQVIESQRATKAAGLVESLLDADIAQVPDIVGKMPEFRQWVDPLLRKELQKAPEGSPRQLHARLGLLPTDASQSDSISQRLLIASPTELPVLRDALKPHRSTLVPKLWSVLDSAKPDDVSLLPAASALADYDADSPRWESVRGKVAQALVIVNPVFLGPWLDALRPVRGKLNAPLAAIFRDKNRPESERNLATNILTDYASDDPNLIADLLMAADPKAYEAFFPIAESRAEKTLPLFEGEIHKMEIQVEREQQSEQLKDQLAERQARAAIALIRMGKAEAVWPLLHHSADPRLRSFIVNWLKPLQADPNTLAAELDRLPPTAKPTPAQGQQLMDAILFHPETSQRRALILALGTYGTEGLSSGERERLTGKLLDLYRNDPDSGIHGAAEWTLRKWGQQEKLQAADAELMKLKDRNDLRWYVNSQGQTFAVIEGPVEFRMGSPPTEPDRIATTRDPPSPDHPPPIRHRHPGSVGRAVSRVHEAEPRSR